MNKKVFLLVAFSISCLASCGKNSESSTVAPKQLGEIENFMVVRNGEKMEVNFSSVSFATSYSLKVSKGEEEILANDQVTAGFQIEPFATSGDYLFKLIAKAEGYLDSEVAEYTYNVTIYDNSDDGQGALISGRTEQGNPIGEFSVVYGSGDIYVGTLTPEMTRKDGKLTYTNKMYYEGHFENDTFNGNGLFTWSTTGDYKDGNTYSGEFFNGGYGGCSGTYYTAANWTRPLEYSGILNWTGVMPASFGVCGKIGEVGKGEFQFANNSIYSGDLLVRADWQYARFGHGFNKWIVKETAGWISGANASLTIYGFEGEFDAVDHAWIYGDGVWYFTDDSGNPNYYAKGKWDGGNRLGNAEGELTILPEWANAQEITF